MSATTIPPHPYINPYQLAETIIGTIIKKTAVALPAGATSNLFTVTGGAIIVSSLIGVVSTGIQNQACNLSIGIAPTVGSPNTAGIGGPTTIQNLAAGSHIAAPFAVGTPGLSLVAPAVPLTTVAVTNNYHGSVAVTVSGGTLTFVFVNGVQAGTSAGTYIVPAHGTISITYSVAPTWTWASTAALVTDTFGSEFIPREFVVPAGNITLTTTATNTGNITWYLAYMQLDNQPGVESSIAVVT